jgi:hypothetical protein
MLFASWHRALIETATIAGAAMSSAALKFVVAVSLAWPSAIRPDCDCRFAVSAVHVTAQPQTGARTCCCSTGASNCPCRATTASGSKREKTCCGTPTVPSTRSVCGKIESTHDKCSCTADPTGEPRAVERGRNAFEREAADSGCVQLVAVASFAATRVVLIELRHERDGPRREGTALVRCRELSRFLL